MEKKTITLEEKRKIQLAMLDEIDSYCREHNIRYSLAFGTLIGAIRHRGFIPWDDDVDLIMPLPDMLRFKQEFKSDRLAYADIDTVPHYEYHFSRIYHLLTYSQPRAGVRSHGVSIDLYPVVGMPDTEEQIQKFLKDIAPLYEKRRKLIAWKHRLLRRFPFAFVPSHRATMRKFHDIVLNSFPYETAKNFLHAGSVRRVNILGFDVFDAFVDVEFEGHTYQSMARYHEYLTHCFGDYMQLPPEDQRHPYHGATYFWK